MRGHAKPPDKVLLGLECLRLRQEGFARIRCLFLVDIIGRITDMGLHWPPLFTDTTKLQKFMRIHRVLQMSGFRFQRSRAYCPGERNNACMNPQSSRSP